MLFRVLTDMLFRVLIMLFRVLIMLFRVLIMLFSLGTHASPRANRHARTPRGTRAAGECAGLFRFGPARSAGVTARRSGSAHTRKAFSS
jgi:hypothetical protein